MKEIKLRKADKYEKQDHPKAVATIRVGRHEAQLTQKQINDLQKELNRFTIEEKE